jgi:hypothetical protein
MLPHGVADPQREHEVTSFGNVDLDGTILSALLSATRTCRFKNLQKKKGSSYVTVVPLMFKLCCNPSLWI